MAKKEGILKNIEIPLYKALINVAVDTTCADAIELGELMNEYFGHFKEESKNWFGAYLNNPEANLYCIVLSKDVTINTISHECFHAVMHILREKGIVYSAKSEECFAYVLGWLVDQVMQVFLEYQNQSK